MKNLLLTTTALFGLMAGVAAATPFTDQVVSGLQAQGYDHIEIVQGLTQLKVEAIRGNSQVEIIYDLATGAVLKQETNTVAAGTDNSPGVEIDTDDGDFIDPTETGSDDSSDDDSDNSDDDGSDDSSDDDSSDDSNDDSGSDDSNDDSDDDHDSNDDHGDDDNNDDDNSNDDNSDDDHGNDDHGNDDSENSGNDSQDD
jgi:hypothetical protein